MKSAPSEGARTPAARLALPAIDVSTALAGRAPVVDLRSPSEFAEDHLPGATSHPLFDDAERALVGTLYKQVSAEQAFSRGLDLAERKIVELVRAIASDVGHPVAGDDVLDRMRALASGGKHGMDRRLSVSRGDERALTPDGFVLHCWRGGLRSQSVCALLRELGLPAVLLDGGYKAYRRHVLECTSALEFPRVLVLRGLTGVGKTLVLREIERLEPGSTLDLEGLAQHRSSILGAAGLEPVSQKAFESRLIARVARGFPAGFVFFEGESRKVGSAVLPERVWGALRGGTDLRLVAPVQRRVRVLSEDYLARPGSREFLRERLPFLEQRIGSRRFDGVLVGLLGEDRIDELVELLLERYYDPLYRGSEPDEPPAGEFEASDPTACAQELLRFARTGA